MDAAAVRVRFRVRGAVQGVGFRPFIYRLGRELGCTGWVANDTAGVVIEAEAHPVALAQLRQRMRSELPPNAAILELSEETIALRGDPEFTIAPSARGGAVTAVVLPDLAPCPDCLRELAEPADRRYRYAFTNCTHCGPRFSIVRAVPYDRPNTTMAGFQLCAHCHTEYSDPGDRRFHAQPVACPACGPRVALRNAAGEEIGTADPIAAAAAAITAGRIVAIKGVGGYLLACDARNDAAIMTLRARKRRPTKPLALLVRDLAAARALVAVDAPAERVLAAPAAPIVLLPLRDRAEVSALVAPGHHELGVMLPAAPLLHLLMQQLPGPIVATSGNRSEEPICIDECEAFARLHDIADLFLTHDRPVARQVDDSVAWFTDGAPRLLRRARGYAPQSIRLRFALPPLLAVGAQLKNTVAVARAHDVILSQHIGDLESLEATRAFERVIADLTSFYDIEPVAIVHDLHPDYTSTRWAERTGAPLLGVQHHHAHHAACLAENGRDDGALGIIWDGTGLGTDGTIWGGEFLLGDARDVQRVAHLRPFRLPGGDAATRQPSRIALALRAQLDSFVPEPREHLLLRMLETGTNAPSTTSMGRLFDGVAALLGLGGTVTYEAEAAIALEHAARRAPAETQSYELPLEGAELDWRPLVAALLQDQRRAVPVAAIAARFHNALVRAAVTVADAVGHPAVALAGGCFQNRILAERIPAALRARGFDVIQHAQLPPGDGSIALGQVAIAAARLRS